jgi:hypothetical protein
MDIFRTLGTELEDAWRAANYDEALLPSLAADALRRADIPTKTTVWEVVEWALGEIELPRQRDINANFGDPPITVYSGPRFHVDIYFWFQGTTSIHQHGFCGAFQVMHGSSIHSWYEFQCEKRINIFTEIGTMSLKTCELLSVGDVQEILGGRAYIHSLFHLEQPSATIVIRTDRSPIDLPQYNYHKPKLAIDPFFDQDTITKKTQLAAALIRAKNPDADRMIAGWLENCDFQTTFNLLSSLRHLLQANQMDQLFKLAEPGARFEAMMAVAEKRHGDDISVLRDVFAHQDMLGEIMNRRGYVTDPEQRFFMALLLNVNGQEQILRLIKQRFPETDPLDKVLDWTFDLANTRIVGLEQSNALGIPDFGDIDLFVFEQILRGTTGAAIEDALRSQYGESASEPVKTVAEKEARIREAVIFRPLLT